MTKTTTNQFIPLVKLVAERRLPRQTIGRTASILEFAHSRNVAPVGLESFIEEQGGIKKCECVAKDAMNPRREEERTRAHDNHLAMLRSRRVTMSDAALEGFVEEGLYQCLIERSEGKLVLLSVKKENSVSKYDALPTEEDGLFDSD